MNTQHKLPPAHHKLVYYQKTTVSKFNDAVQDAKTVATSLGIVVPDNIKNKTTYKIIAGRRIQVLLPAVIYYLKIIFPDRTTVYKIGFTSMSVQQRINYFELPPTAIVYVLGIYRCKCAREAYFLEQALHTRYKNFRYYGKQLLASGNTELYVQPLM